MTRWFVPDSLALDLEVKVIDDLSAAGPDARKSRQVSARKAAKAKKAKAASEVGRKNGTKSKNGSRRPQGKG